MNEDLDVSETGRKDTLKESDAQTRRHTEREKKKNCGLGSCKDRDTNTDKYNTCVVHIDGHKHSKRDRHTHTDRYIDRKKDTKRRIETQKDIHTENTERPA